MCQKDECVGFIWPVFVAVMSVSFCAAIFDLEDFFTRANWKLRDIN